MAKSLLDLELALQANRKKINQLKERLKTDDAQKAQLTRDLERAETERETLLNELVHL